MAKKKEIIEQTFQNCGNTVLDFCYGFRQTMLTKESFKKCKDCDKWEPKNETLYPLKQVVSKKQKKNR